jgi:hypothetical protein
MDPLILQDAVDVTDADLTPAQSRAIKQWSRAAIKQVLASYDVDRRFQLILCAKWSDFYKATQGTSGRGTILEVAQEQILEIIEQQQIAPKRLANIDAARKNSRIYVGPHICALLAEQLPLPETVDDTELGWMLFVLAHEACHFVLGADGSRFQELLSHAEELERAARHLVGPRLDAVASQWVKGAHSIQGYIEGLQQMLSLAQEGLVHIWAFITLLEGRLGYAITDKVLDKLVEHELTPLGEGPYSLGVLLTTVLLHQAVEGRRDHALPLAKRLATRPNAPFFLACEIDALQENITNLNIATDLTTLFPKYHPTSLIEWPRHFFAGQEAVQGILIDAVAYAQEHSISPGWLFGIDTGVLTLEKFAQWGWGNSD